MVYIQKSLKVLVQSSGLHSMSSLIFELQASADSLRTLGNSKLVQSTCVPWTTLFKKSNSICEHTWWTIWRHKSQAESLQYHKSYKCFRTGSWLSRRWLNHASARDPSTKTTNFQFFWCQFALHIKTDVNLKNSLYRDLSILAQGS